MKMKKITITLPEPAVEYLKDIEYSYQVEISIIIEELIYNRFVYGHCIRGRKDVKAKPFSSVGSEPTFVTPGAITQ